MKLTASDAHAARKPRGFTIVEILIVVVILGILAAIVIPQFSNASESANASSLLTQLQTVRSQLELYQAQHSGDYPALATLQTGTPDNWTGLTTQTDADGTSGTAYGPYLQKAPVNPYTNTSNVIAIDGTAAATVGWLYDEDTGEIKAAVPSAKATAAGFDTTNDVETY